MTKLPFDVWAEDPPRASRFADAMQFLHSDPGFQPSYLLSAFDFASPSLGPEPLFVDIGGSTGHISLLLARTYPNLTCIVQDLPSTVQAAKQQHSHLPRDLQDRVSFMSHDFWTEQPVKGADMYYFRWVFHDWSDALAVRILRQLVPAMKAGARVLINDICVPPPGEMSLYQELRIRLDTSLFVSTLPLLTFI
jgi:SAM-dependent methyltransferase